MELTEELKSLLIDTAKRLKGSARRQFMARAVLQKLWEERNGHEASLLAQLMRPLQTDWR